jgi:hypothetical protein
MWPGFRKLLGFLAQSPHLKQFQVYGVYLGWRGEKVRSGKDPLGRVLWLPSQLSFYPIKRIGNDVGTMPMISEALFWMVHDARNAPRPGRTVLIGHSFGAMVLENAVAQAIASGAATNIEGGGTVPAPADLVLLLNPASDSLRAKGLIEMLNRMGSSAGQRFIDKDRPLVVSVTSEGDWATGKFFPARHRDLQHLPRHRTYSRNANDRSALPEGTNQRKFITQTPGHNKLLRSHVISVDQAQIAPSSRGAASGAAARTIFDQNLSAPLPSVNSSKSRTWRFRSISKSGGTCTSEIQPYPEALMQTGYWIVQAPKEIIYDHGDIFNEQALALYAAIFRIANPIVSKGGVQARRISAPPDPMPNPSPDNKVSPWHRSHLPFPSPLHCRGSLGLWTSDFKAEEFDSFARGGSVRRGFGAIGICTTEMGAGPQTNYQDWERFAGRR